MGEEPVSSIPRQINFFSPIKPQRFLSDTLNGLACCTGTHLTDTGRGRVVGSCRENRWILVSGKKGVAN